MPCGLPESEGSLSANGSHETHFNIQRRVYDYQLALARTPSDLEQRHQAFIQLYNTTAHQGLLADQRLPPIPVEILGAAQGRRYPQEVLAEKFAHALFPRTTNRYGCVTLHSYHFYVESGVPQTQVLLWVYGEPLRALSPPSSPLLPNPTEEDVAMHQAWGLLSEETKHAFGTQFSHINMRVL